MSEPSVPVSKLEELAAEWENYTDVGPHFRYSRCAAALRALIAEAGQETRCDGSGYNYVYRLKTAQGEEGMRKRCPGCPACTPQVEGQKEEA